MIKDSWFVPIYTTESWYRFSLTGLACHKPLETNVDVNWGANVYADLDIWEFAEQYLWSKAEFCEYFYTIQGVPH